MPEVIFWWWQNLQRYLSLLAQEWGLVRLVLFTPDSQVPVISSSCFMVQLIELIEHNSPATLKRLSLKPLQYNFQSPWVKWSLAVAAQVEIASLIFANGPKVDLSSGFWTLSVKPQSPWEGTEGIWSSDFSKRRSWALESVLSLTLSGLDGGQGKCWWLNWRDAHHEYWLCS